MDTEETYEVIAVRYGTRQTTRSAVYLNYSLYGEADAAIGMDYYFWIVRNARRTIVVDTGYGAVGAQHRNRTFLLDPAQALRELGVDPATATVVLTHAHYDHVGNLALFPQAPLVLPRTEYAFWTGPLRERFLFHHTIEDGDIADLRRAHADERVQLVDEATTVAPGVELFVLGGHSAGQAVLTVRTADGVVVLASDATHYYEELDRDMPFFVVDDLSAMYAGFDRLKQWRRDLDAVIVPGHDPDVIRRHQPLDGVLGGNAVRIGPESPQLREEGTR